MHNVMCMYKLFSHGLQLCGSAIFKKAKYLSTAVSLIWTNGLKCCGIFLPSISLLYGQNLYCITLYHKHPKSNFRKYRKSGTEIGVDEVWLSKNETTPRSKLQHFITKPILQCIEDLREVIYTSARDSEGGFFLKAKVCHDSSRPTPQL